MRLTITDAFRKSMNWLHTWAGVTVGAILFAIFWMGTLSVFDAEIDRWMKPELRIAPVESSIALDDAVATIADEISGGTSFLNVSPPGDRSPVISIGYNVGDGYQQALLDPTTGERLTATDSLGASGFFFPFHFRLHISWQGLGYWIVGFATMAMLVLLVSGIFIHRKIIQDFFTFRPTKALRRSTLDLHNMTGLIALPFHFFLPLTGLIIFAAVYLPWALKVPYGGDDKAIGKEVYGYIAPEPSGEPMGPLVSLDAVKAKAEAAWSARSGEQEKADFLRIYGYGDANAVIQVRQVFPSRRVEMNRNAMTFSAETGEVLLDFSTTPIGNARAWLSGLHFIQFDHWPLRWLYLAAGLSGCAMIATGNLFWMRARTRKREPEPMKVRAIRALTIGAVSGIMASSAAFLLANRLLTNDVSIMGADRSSLEMWAFFVVWIATFVHAAIREGRAWAEQSWTIAGLCVAAVLANWATTGDHPIAAASAGVWAVAGVDLVLLAAAGVAASAALKLQRGAEAGGAPASRRRLRAAAAAPAE